MGRAGREGFGPSCGWVQLSDRRNDFDIRAKYQEEQNRGKQHSNHIDTYFIKRSVPTGQGDQQGMSQKWLIWCEAQKGSEDTWHVCVVKTGISPSQAPTVKWTPVLWVMSRGRLRGCTWTHGVTGLTVRRRAPRAPRTRKKHVWWRSSAKKRFFCLGSKVSLES